ncbi:hypothetical protein R50076_06810 [Gilvimarinus japonicus]
MYANDQEICCKSVGQDGVAVAAFPDSCWSPPAPGAGPLLIPYPNSNFASNLKKGSTSVCIGNSAVALKDQSYLDKSTGNEPATKNFSQGLSTATIKGKTYFTDWSQDVKIEGLNVCCNMHSTTHNHG